MRLSGWAEDFAGNQTTLPESVYRIDNTPPRYTGSRPDAGQRYSSFSVVPAYSDQHTPKSGCNSWGGSGVNLVVRQLIDESIAQGSCSGGGRIWNLNGIAGCTVASYSGSPQGAPNPPTITSDSQVVYVRARDGAGNMSAPERIDPDIQPDGPPQIELNTDPAALREIWKPDARQFENQFFNFRAWDKETGIARVEIEYPNLPGVTPLGASNCTPTAANNQCGKTADRNQAWTLPNGRQIAREGVFKVRLTAFDRVEGSLGGQQASVEYTHRVDKTALGYPNALRDLEDEKISRMTRLTVDAVDPGVGFFDGVAEQNHPSGPYRGHFEICRVGNDCSTPAPSTNDGAGGRAEYGDWEPIHQPHPTRAEPCTANTLENPNGFNLKAENTSAPASGHVTAQFTCRFNPNTYPQGEYFVRFHGWDMAGNPSVSEPVRVELKPRAYCPL